MNHLVYKLKNFLFILMDNSYLEEEAERIAKEFSAAYCRLSNPAGKKRIILYGEYHRSESFFQFLIQRELSRKGIEAFVFRVPQSPGQDSDFSVNLQDIFSRGLGSSIKNVLGDVARDTFREISALDVKSAPREVFVVGADKKYLAYFQHCLQGYFNGKGISVIAGDGKGYVVDIGYYLRRANISHPPA